MNEIDTANERKRWHLKTTLLAWSVCVVFPSSRVPCCSCMVWDAPVRRAPCSPGRKRKIIGSAFAYRMVLPSSSCWVPVFVTTCCPKTIWKTRIMIRLSTESCASAFAARNKTFVFGSQSCSIRDGLTEGFGKPKNLSETLFSTCFHVFVICPRCRG